MNKVLVLAVFLMMATVSTVHAEVKTGSISLTPFAGGYFFDNKQGLKNTIIAGLRAGYDFTDHLSLEGYASFMKTKVESLSYSPNNNVYTYGIEGQYNFIPENRLVPFIAVGVGGIHYGYPPSRRGNDFSVDYGVGLKFFVTENVTLRGDIRQVIPFEKSTPLNYEAALGISFYIPMKKKEVAPVAVAKQPAIPMTSTEPKPAQVPVATQAPTSESTPAVTQTQASEPVPAAAITPAATPVVVDTLKLDSSKSPSVDASFYTIHSLSVRNKVAAQLMLKKIDNALSPAFITTINLRGLVWYRLDIGLFNSKQDALNKMSELKSKGILDKTPFVGPAVKYTIDLSVFNNREDATSEMKKLSKRGISAYIINGTDGLFRVVCGAFTEKSEANSAIKELARVGIKGKLVAIGSMPRT